MKLNFKLDRDEYINFCLEYLPKTKKFKNMFRLAYIYLSIVLLFCICIIKDKSLLIAVSILILFICIFMKKIGFFMIKKMLHEKYEQDEYSFLFSNTTIVLTDDNIIIVRTIGEKTFKWSFVNEVSLIDNFLFLRFINKEYIFIKLELLENSETMELVSYIKDKTNLRVTNIYPDNLKYI